MANNTDWLNISQMSGGTGETALSLTALTNSSLSAKTATVTAKNTTYNVSGTTTVTIQGFVPTLTLSRSTVRFDSTGGTATFTVYSNTAWTIAFPAIVQSYSTSAGTGDTEITIALGPNPDEVAKIDTGILRDCYSINFLYLTIVQESFIVELNVYPDDDIVFDNTGSTTFITVESNADWELEFPNWITPSVTSGTSGTTIIMLEASENGANGRSGEVTVYAGSKSVTINVSQPAYVVPYLTVIPTALTYSYTAESKTFIVNSFPGWSAEVISTGETHWGEDIAFTLTLEIPSANTTINDLKQAGCIINGVVVPGSTYTFPTSGTYTVLYPYLDTTTVPVLTGIPYVSSIEISDMMTTIPDNCFAGLGLTSITIPSSITSMGNLVFDGCSNITDIYANPVTAPQISSTTFKNIAEGGTLHYPNNSYSTWLSGDKYYLGWYSWNNVEPNIPWLFTITYNVTSTTEETPILYNSYYVEAIKDEQTGEIMLIPSGHSYSSYTGYTFSQTGRQQLSFSLYTTNTSAFLGVSTAATDVVFNNYETEFNPSLRVEGSGHLLTGLTLNRDGLYFTVNDNRVKMLPSVRKLTYGPNTRLLSADQSAISGVTGLTEVDMSRSSISYLPNNSFSGCTGLTAISFSENLKTIPAGCCRDCRSLQTAEIPEGVTTIDSYAFYDCASLTAITLPSTLANFGNYVFDGYSNWPENLLTIWSYAIVPPSGTSNTIKNIATGGTFYYPAGSSYTSQSPFSELQTNSGWNFVAMSAADYEIRIFPETITVGSTGGTRSLTVTSLSPWTASSDRMWAAISSNSGASGVSEVNVTIIPEEYEISRTATITFTNAAGSKTVTVEQGPCMPMKIKNYLGIRNNAGEQIANAYIFDYGVVFVNSCSYDFSGIQEITNVTAGTSAKTVVFGMNSGITDCATGYPGCLQTLQEVNIDIPDVTYISHPFGETAKTSQTLTAVTFTSTDNLTKAVGMFNNLQNLQKVKLGNLSNCLYNPSTTYPSDRNFGYCSSLTDLEIDALPDMDLTGLWRFDDCTALTQQSLVNILNALPVTTNNRKITLGAENRAKLTEDQLAIATDKGWTIYM